MNKITHLDDYEKDIEDHVDESIDIEDVQQEMALIGAAANRHATRKKSITIRVHEMDLEAIKLMASRNGMPYQTYLNMIIHREVSNFLS